MEVSELRKAIDAQIAENRALGALISAENERQRHCDATYAALEVLLRSLGSWCIASSAYLHDCLFAECEWQLDPSPAISFARDAVSCASDPGPACTSRGIWVGAFVCCIGMLLVGKCVWYSAKLWGRFWLMRSIVLADKQETERRMPSVRLHRMATDRVQHKRRLTAVFKVGLALAIYFAYCMFSLSATEVLGALLRFLRLTDEQEESRVDQFWSIVANVPAAIFGPAVLNRLVFQYFLAVAGLPLFKMVMACLQSAAEDVAPADDDAATPRQQASVDRDTRRLQ